MTQGELWQPFGLVLEHEMLLWQEGGGSISWLVVVRVGLSQLNVSLLKILFCIDRRCTADFCECTEQHSVTLL